MALDGSNYKLTASGIKNGNALYFGKRSQNLATSGTLNITANTWTEIADIGSDFGNDSQGVLIMVNWSNASSGGTTYYWQTCGLATCGFASASNYYNANPDETINFTFTHHHRIINNPEFHVDSDSSEGSYGDLTLYMRTPTSPSSLTFTGFGVFVQPLLTSQQA